MNVRSVLKAGVDLSTHIEKISNATLVFNGNNTFSVKYIYNTSESATHRSSMPLTHVPALNGYSAKLTGAALDAVRSDPNVKYLTEDSIVSIDSTSGPSPTTGPAARALVNRGTRRPSSTLGLGVDIYVLGETIAYAI
jgi:hypothetical protein